VRRGVADAGDASREVPDAEVTDAGVAPRRYHKRGVEIRVRKQTERRKGDSFVVPDEGMFGPNPTGGYRP